MKLEEIPFDRIFPAKQELTPQEKANREKFKKVSGVCSNPCY